MKKMILIGLVLLGLAGVSSAVDQMVFIDLEQVFEGFYKTKLSKAQVDVQKKDMEAERQIRLAEMELISDEVDALKKEARDNTLSKDIRDEKRILYEERLLELRAVNKDISEFVDRINKQLQTQVTRVSKILMDEVRQAVVEYATSEGVLAVIDSSSRGAQVSVFVYTHPDVDITDTILMRLNRMRPNEGSGAVLFGANDSEASAEATSESSE